MGSPRGGEKDDMTVKRDFKRRVRQRQARTGESYVTARRHLLAARPAAASEAAGEDDADEPLTATGGGAGGGGRPGARDPAISVVEVLDVTDEARRIGLSCRVVMFPSLVQRIPPARVLERLRVLLIATAGDPAIARLSRLALGQQPGPRRRTMFDVDALRRFLYRARAGMGGMLDDGATLAFHLPDGDDLIPIMCTLSSKDDAIELSAIDSLVPESWSAFVALFQPEAVAPGQAPSPREIVDHLTAALLGSGRGQMPWPPLYVEHDGRRCLVKRVPFVIGSNAVCDLAIDAVGVASEHAVVVLRDDEAYLSDLGSPGGVVHHGRRIARKRIEEGDVFVLAGHEIRFTFRSG